MTMNRRIPLVDPGLYTLAHSQEFLAPAFFTRDMVVPTLRRQRSIHRRGWIFQVNRKHRRKLFTYGKILVLQRKAGS